MRFIHLSEFHFTEKTYPKSKFHSSRHRPCEKKVAIVVENGLMGSGAGVSKSSKNGVFYKSSYLRFDFFISMQN